jgi:hypothetical protein
MNFIVVTCFHLLFLQASLPKHFQEMLQYFDDLHLKLLLVCSVRSNLMVVFRMLHVHSPTFHYEFKNYFKMVAKQLVNLDLLINLVILNYLIIVTMHEYGLNDYDLIIRCSTSSLIITIFLYSIIKNNYYKIL